MKTGGRSLCCYIKWHGGDPPATFDIAEKNWKLNIIGYIFVRKNVKKSIVTWDQKNVRFYLTIFFNET